MSLIHKCSELADAHYRLPKIVEIKNEKADIISVLRVNNSILCKQEPLEEGLVTCENVYDSQFDVYEEDLNANSREIKYFMINDVNAPSNLSIKVDISALEEQFQLPDSEETQIMHAEASDKYNIETQIKVEHCDSQQISPADCVTTLNSHIKGYSPAKDTDLKKGSSAKRNSINSIYQQTTKTHIHDKPFSCDICKTKFTLKGNLQKHMKIHTAKKPFACHICGFKFFWLFRLNKHMRSHEEFVPNKKRFSCHICKNKFVNNSNLMAHIKKHSGVKPFSCDICGKKYLTKGSLGVHMRNHTGEKPFSCHICSSKYTTKCSLMCHLKTH